MIRLPSAGIGSNATPLQPNWRVTPSPSTVRNTTQEVQDTRNKTSPSSNKQDSRWKTTWRLLDDLLLLLDALIPPDIDFLASVIVVALVPAILHLLSRFSRQTEAWSLSSTNTAAQTDISPLHLPFHSKHAFETIASLLSSPKPSWASSIAATRNPPRAKARKSRRR